MHPFKLNSPPTQTFCSGNFLHEFSSFISELLKALKYNYVPAESLSELNVGQWWETLLSLKLAQSDTNAGIKKHWAKYFNLCWKLRDFLKWSKMSDFISFHNQCGSCSVIVMCSLLCLLGFDFKPWEFSGSWDHSLTLPLGKLKSHPWASRWRPSPSRHTDTHTHSHSANRGIP